MAQDENPTIIFLHGNSSSSRVFEEAVDLLTISCDVLLIDLIGHAEGPMTGAYELSEHVKYVLDCCEEVVGDILIVGHSLGGHVAVQLMDKLRDVKGVILSGMYPFNSSTNADEVYNNTPLFSTYLNAQTTMESLDATIDAAIQNKEVAEVIKEDFLCADPMVREAWRHFETNYQEIFDEVQALKNTESRQVLVYGVNDPFVNPNYLQVIKESESLKLELMPVENCGHYVSLERPQEFADVVSEVARECLG